MLARKIDGDNSMVKLNKIYTRTGDEGLTGLSDGSRVPKDDTRVNAYGTVDEANASIGVARHYVQARFDGKLGRIQHDLFDLGADISTPFAANESQGSALRILPAQVERLEKEIDMMNSRLTPLDSFVLPGGIPGSAHLHLARTQVRRAERLAVHMSHHTSINPEAVRYLNRLSDHLFVMARCCNNYGLADVLWKPGNNR